MQSCHFVFVCLCLLLCFSVSLTAQTTIFNAPSTDVSAERQAYVEGNLVFHFDSLKNGGFQTYGYKTVYGLTKKVEVGTNFYFTRSSNESLKEFQANAKWKFLENEKYGLAVAAGTQVFIPVRNRSGLKPVTMLYSNASKQIPKTGGLRVTGGFYNIFGARNDFGSKRGAIFAVEQPIIRRLSFIGDWYSGKNRFGYSFAGFSLATTKKQILFAGYNFGNSGRANNSLAVSYGIIY